MSEALTSLVSQKNNHFEVENEFQSNAPLSQCVKNAVEKYLIQLNGHSSTGLYDIVIQEIEKPLLEVVLQHADNNQTSAAKILGISRGTLRKKLNQHHIE